MSTPPFNLVLTGFMATGKSTIAPSVAARLGFECIDTDQAIEQRQGRSIASIFAEDGEPAFRALEATLCQELAERPQLVISTGGGTLLNPKSRALFLRTSLVICLWAAPEVLETRLSQGEGRPLASAWRALLKSRAPIYEELPHRIDTGRCTPAEATERIVELWKRRSSTETS